MFIQRSVDIVAPPETVWAVLTDVEHWPEWTASMTSLRLDAGPFAAGVRVRIKQPKLMAATWRVTVCDPPHRFAWETSMPGMQAVAWHRIEPTPEGSRVTLEVNSTGLLAGVVGLLMGDIGARYVRMEADGLKRRVEGRSA